MVCVINSGVSGKEEEESRAGEECIMYSRTGITFIANIKQGLLNIMRAGPTAKSQFGKPLFGTGSQGRTVILRIRFIQYT